MTKNYSYKVEPIKPTAYQLWKEFRPYIYKILKQNKCRDLDDAYAESYFFIDKALSTLDESKSGVKYWLLSNIKWKLYRYLFVNKYLIKRPTYLAQRADTHEMNFLSLNYNDKEGFEKLYNPVGDSDVDYNEYDKNVAYRQLKKSFNILDDKTRDIITSYYGIGCKKLSRNELAAIYNCKPQNIDGYVMKAKKKIHRYLTRINTNIGDVLDYEA